MSVNPIYARFYKCSLVLILIRELSLYLFLEFFFLESFSRIEFQELEKDED